MSVEVIVCGLWGIRFGALFMLGNILYTPLASDATKMSLKNQLEKGMAADSCNPCTQSKGSDRSRGETP